MRRFAMTTSHDGNERGGGDARLGRKDVAGLVGSAWLRYLDSRWERDEFATGAGRLLTAAPYARPEHVDRLHALELAKLCAEWVNAQRRANTATAPQTGRPARPSRALPRWPFGRGADASSGRPRIRRRDATPFGARAADGAGTH
jgi:hypothetical protein